MLMHRDFIAFPGNFGIERMDVSPIRCFSSPPVGQVAGGVAGTGIHLPTIPTIQKSSSPHPVPLSCHRILPFFQKQSARFLFNKTNTSPVEYLKSGNGSEGGVQYICRSAHPVAGQINVPS